MNNLGPIALWRNYKQIHSLTGFACVSCKKVYYPKKYLCSCGSRNFKDFKLSETGRLITFTEITHPTEQFKTMVPYILGMVELENNVKVLAQITDASLQELSIGMQVKAVFRKLYEQGPKGAIVYGIKFIKDA